MQEQLLRGAMWPGDGAIHPLMDGPSYISSGGGVVCLSQSYQTGWSTLKPGQTIVQTSKGQVREKQNGPPPSPTPRASPMFFPG